jgi:crotonobetainyl-CoA:carnitine CoA-transferase CaiB-like acyl-CoA transferase
VSYPGLAAQPDRPAPVLGADTEDVARMLGYDASALAALRAGGAFGKAG